MLDQHFLHKKKEKLHILHTFCEKSRHHRPLQRLAYFAQSNYLHKHISFSPLQPVFTELWSFLLLKINFVDKKCDFGWSFGLWNGIKRRVKMFFLVFRKSTSISKYKTATIENFSPISISGGSCLVRFLCYATYVVKTGERVNKKTTEFFFRLILIGFVFKSIKMRS